MTDPITSVSVHLTPRTSVAARDRIRDGERTTALLLGDETQLCICDDFGDVGVVAVTGALIDALELLRRNARGRIAAAHAGMPILPDTLEASSLAEALRGMAPGEIIEAFGR